MERFAIKIDKKLKANLYKICRLCGIDNPDMVPIISDKPENDENISIDVEVELEMQQKINLLLGLSVGASWIDDEKCKAIFKNILYFL